MEYNNHCPLGLGAECSTGLLQTNNSIHKGQRSHDRSCTLQWSSDELSYNCLNPQTDNSGGGNGADFIPPLIDNETKRVLEIYIQVIGFIVTSSLGVFSNVINIAVYWKQGITDSITLGFFALSVSDLILVAMPLFTGSLYAAKFIFPNSPVDFHSVHYISFGFVRSLTSSSSLLITAFVSIERCCCIVLPFKVQTIFTRKKTGIFLFIMIILQATFLCMLPALAQLRWLPNSRDKNTSASPRQRLRVKYSDFGQHVEIFYSTTLSFIVPIGTQVIVTVCAFIMLRGLKKSARFRAKATAAKILATGNKESNEKVMSKHQVQNESETKYNDNRTENGSNAGNQLSESNDVKLQPQSTLSQRDARLVRTVVFLVCILSACNVPFLAVTFAWLTVPDLNIGRPYQNTLSVVYSVVYILGNVNASSNVIVYYRTSSRFREVAKGLFNGSKK